MTVEQVKIGTKTLSLTKATYNSNFRMRTVLTVDPFDYVDLWLRRENKDEAQHYWRQAKNFYRAAHGLPVESAPLILYYCFMNAAKALLASKGATINPYHGVAAHQMRGPNSKFVLSNEGIKIKQGGIAPAISMYFNETETSTIHTLEDVLYNIVCVHRTYCLSYANRMERFIPLKRASYVRDQTTGDVRLFAEVVDGFDWLRYRRQLPPEVVEATGSCPAIQSSTAIQWSTVNRPTDAELASLSQLNAELRRSIHYINGAHTLWYVKTSGTYAIQRAPVTLMLAAMHRLSEICRYKPSQLRSFLDGSRNWLLSEFVAMSPPQFLDEIACEMTGHQIMIPNVRVPI
ncbi:MULTISPECIES: YaaC family protein [unclassified Methylobacterium]|uniref:YaaC family protein n=1 Tax=unclassified Methylobacterium TaxID=2615210 RepID=UPI001AEDB8F0|nr:MULTISPECIES: YaaC family protein [unclassified Methylobacterium]